MNRLWFWAFFIICTSVVLAQENKIELRDVSFGDLKMAGFSLNSAREINIEAEGAGIVTRKYRKRSRSRSYSSAMFCYGWILDSKTREVVWQMTVNNTEKVRGTKFNREFNDRVYLEAGQYEVYFAAQAHKYQYLDDSFFSLFNLFKEFFEDENELDEESSEWKIIIEDLDVVLGRQSMMKHQKARKKQAVVSITGLRNSDFKQVGFKLTEPGRFHIYALGEVADGIAADYAWISRSEESERIWEADPDESDHAGGAEKNRRWDETIYLESGNYWVYYVMDDSHAPNVWNENMPFDPAFYGITLTGIPGEYNPRSIKKLVKREIKPIVEITRVGDDCFFHRGFQTDEPLKIRIYAIGEGTRRRLVDYGWIENAKDRRIVWEMDYNDTRNAGGASKNRMVDDMIELPAGAYVVYYKSDDSHSFDDWNDSPPYSPKSWGITVYPADPKYNMEKIKQITREEMEGEVISQIIRVGDDERERRRFTLEEDMDIRIYAIGEGEWEEMFDYGWIEDLESGRIVWEMEYENTRWAGGNKKNRKVNKVLHLEAGRYMLLYQSDDSHSYDDWNADMPNDPEYYGITIYKEGK